MIKPVSSTTVPLAKLTQNGLTAFGKLVTNAPSMAVDEVKKRILDIATGSGTTETIDKKTQVPLFPELNSRQQTAELVARILNAAGIEAGPSSGHEPLFSWFGLVFLPSLCSRTKNGTLNTLMKYRYLLTRSSTDFYRHLVACPYWLFRRYEKHSRVFLSQQAFIMPEVVEQIVSRPFLINSSGVVELIDRLYWDDSTNGPRDGFTSTTTLKDPPPGYATKSPNPGTLRAFESTLGQLQCTYDLRSMSSDQIFAKLPVEFKEWLSRKNSET